MRARQDGDWELALITVAKRRGEFPRHDIPQANNEGRSEGVSSNSHDTPAHQFRVGDFP